MRERLERCVLLPFSLGCISESSVVVRRPDCHIKRSSDPQLSPPYHLTTPTRTKEGREKEDEEEDDDEDVQSLPRFQRLFKNFKNFSQLLLYKEEDDEIGDEEIPIMEGGGGMEIGFPTDVKHVTHIGFDGAATSILSVNWRQPTADVDFFSTGNDSPHPPPAVAMVAAPGGTAA
ncbi:PREDICTED: CRIB domain-containing protein RIC4-like [Ipomoea nil]|uniref:CRIB domain-containing protein RIC4-like n=1 Tax=Ipomoea nil TaxID=35883 RepID=UPI000901C30E|nr:PREDICTED: CRIB domain-containing protein RIC4-like [Ipomoea nil]